MTVKELAAYLHYSEDELDIAEIKAVITAGEHYLRDLIGVDLDFKSDGASKELLKNWCRYYLNNASEYFAENFRQEIMSLQFCKASEVLNEAATKS